MKEGRRCPGCGLTKTRADFAKNQHRCRACKSLACKQWREKYPGRQRASGLRWLASRPEWRRKTETRRRESAKYRANHPDKVSAHYAVRDAIRVGKMAKPATCSLCPSSQRIEAHHDDYARPLEIRWLCSACHTAYHHANPGAP